jgi:hypothetical protein
VSDVHELEERLSEAASDLSVWASLCEHPGWQRLVAVAEGQVNERAKRILHSPLKNQDGIFEQEFTKGEASGIELFRRIPDVQREQAQELVQQLQKEIENETTELTDGGSDGDTGPERRELLDPDSPTFGDAT